MKNQFLSIIAVTAGLVLTNQTIAVGKGQSGSREYKLLLSQLNKDCHIHLQPGMKLDDIFSARLSKDSIQTSIDKQYFTISIPDITKLVHKEVDNEATFSGKVLDMDPNKNQGNGVTLFRTFYRDNDDNFYIRCQPEQGKIFGKTFKLNKDGSLTPIQE